MVFIVKLLAYQSPFEYPPGGTLFPVGDISCSFSYPTPKTGFPSENTNKNLVFNTKLGKILTSSINLSLNGINKPLM